MPTEADSSNFFQPSPVLTYALSPVDEKTGEGAAIPSSREAFSVSLNHEVWSRLKFFLPHVGVLTSPDPLPCY
jgi:hypothetical protein